MSRKTRPITRRQVVIATIVWSVIIGGIIAALVAVLPVVGIAATGDYPGHAVVGLEEDHPVVIAALWVHGLR